VKAKYADWLRMGRWADSYGRAIVPPDILQHPVYALGLSGTGKSTLLANLSQRLHEQGEGVLVIDHKDGDLARSIASRANSEKLIFVAPGECYFDGIPHHWGLNVLEVKRRDRFGFAQVQSNTMRMFERMERANFLIMQQMRLHLDAAIRLALYRRDATLLDVRRILTERDYRLSLSSDPQVPVELREHFDRFDDPKQTTAYVRAQAVNSSIPRLKEFLTDPQVGFMVTQPASTIHLEEWLDAGYLVVCDFATGLTQTQSELLANLILAMFLNAVFTRRVEDDSTVWRLVADEFDRLAGDNFAELIDKARSYRALPIMANQSLSQLVFDNDVKLQKAVLRSPVKITFRVSHDDADAATWVHPVELRDSLSTLSDYSAVLTLTKGLPGLMDSGASELILLDPLQGAEDKDALSDAIRSQKAHTVSERALTKRATMEGDYGNQPTRKDSLHESREPVPLGDDPTGAGGAELPVDLPGLNQLAGLQNVVPGPTQPRRRHPKRGSRQASDQPGVPAAAQRPGAGGGQTDREAGQSPDQVGAELPHPGRSPRPQPAPGGPRVGDAPLPPKRAADLPDD
jgi:hypothetical protein